MYATGMSRRPLCDVRFSLLGPGRVGRSLAAWLIASGARLESVGGRRTGIEVAGHTVLAASALDSGDDDLLLVAVPETAITETATLLARRPQARIALHVSGARPSEDLAALRAGGSRVGTFHPLRAFPEPEPDPRAARTTFFGLGGDPEAVALGARIAAAWGADSQLIEDHVRPLYHLAAVVAAGGAATLVAAAATMATELELGETVSEGYRQLTLGAVDALDPKAPETSITGPVARGSMELLAQLDQVSEHSPSLYPLVVLLSLETLRQIEGHRKLTADQTALRAALRDRCRIPGFLVPLLS